MSCEPLGSALPLFSTRVKFARQFDRADVSAVCPSRTFNATARVPLAMPERSIGRKSGSICTTTIEPGGLGLWRETNGWSIQPPASCRRLGIEPSSLATGESSDVSSADTHAFAGFAMVILFLDPLVSDGQSFVEWCVRLPFQNFFDEGVVAELRPATPWAHPDCRCGSASRRRFFHLRR